jgi:hypothetical protein
MTKNAFGPAIRLDSSRPAAIGITLSRSPCIWSKADRRLKSESHLSGDKAVFDVFRFEGKEIVEHWANEQEKGPAPNVSGRTQLDGPAQVFDLDKTDANKALMIGYFHDVVPGGQSAKAAE